ncbi:Os10g0447950 [Oryza sativa Japonica Group]|uniref:Os10g0447950 protein n=1 Tax=Oryza sativa subsp. japonica TaxID=39947 RepID=A0A0P0XUR4_ORYSJ|nr:Os10g0447950 [Oryza sativa Japonica Group]
MLVLLRRVLDDDAPLVARRPGDLARPAAAAAVDDDVAAVADGGHLHHLARQARRPERADGDLDVALGVVAPAAERVGAVHALAPADGLADAVAVVDGRRVGHPRRGEPVRGDLLVGDDLGTMRAAAALELVAVGGEVPPEVAEEDAGVGEDADDHRREHAEEELAERDAALDGDDEVLRVADGRRRRPDVGARREREEERLRREVVLARHLEDELGEDDAGGVVGEERAGDGGDDADAEEEVLAAAALPRQHVAEVLEHVGALQEDGDDHGAEEEAEDGEVDGGVRLLGCHHAEEHHQHGAQEGPRRATHRHERHRREHGQHPEDRERHASQHHLRRAREHHLLRLARSIESNWFSKMNPSTDPAKTGAA